MNNKNRYIILSLFIFMGCVNNYKEYHENGNLKFKVPLNKDGHYEGIGRSYDIEGNLISKGLYCNGLMHDTVKTYHKNGNIHVVMKCEYGLVSGEVREFNDSRELIKYAIFRNDTCLYSEIFNEGKKVSEDRLIELNHIDSLYLGENYYIDIKANGPIPEKGATKIWIKIDKEMENFLTIGRNTDSVRYNFLPKEIGSYIVEGKFWALDSLRKGNVYSFKKKFVVLPDLEQSD